MIEVVSISGSGAVIDRAEADDPASAILAARTLLHEAADSGHADRLLTVAFYVEGRMIRLTGMVGLR